MNYSNCCIALNILFIYLPTSSLRLRYELVDLEVKKIRESLEIVWNKYLPEVAAGFLVIGFFKAAGFFFITLACDISI